MYDYFYVSYRCQQIYKVNYTYIVSLWHDSALQNKFSLVYIVCFHWSMSRWGNGEPGNYTHIILMARNLCFITKSAHSARFGIGCIITFFVTRMVLWNSPITRTKTGWGQSASLFTMLAVPRSTLVKNENSHPYSLLVPGFSSSLVNFSSCSS